MSNEDKYIGIARMLDSEQQDEHNPYQATWKKMEEMKDIEQFDTDSAWTKMKDKFESEDLIPESKPIANNRFTRRFIGIAASIILGVVAGFFWNQFEDRTTQIANNTNEVIVHELTDGSIVYLKPQSELAYRKTFNNNARDVQLKGEAFFEVERNEALPFRVYAQDALVTVLGTSFNVRVVESDHQVEVLVKTGKVMLSSHSDVATEVSLLPNEMGILNNNKLTKVSVDKTNYMAWKDKKLVFKDASLNQVVSDLSHAYNVSIVLNNTDLDTLAITSTYYQMNVDELIESICLTLNLNYQKTEKNYILVSQ